MRPRSGCWRNAVSIARAWRGAISASMACGRTTCCSACCTRIFAPNLVFRILPHALGSPPLRCYNAPLRARFEGALNIGNVLGTSLGNVWMMGNGLTMWTRVAGGHCFLGALPVVNHRLLLMGCGGGSSFGDD